MFLEVKELYKSYGEVQALRGASFTLDEQEIVCILGPSGCGKTTLLQSLGGFVEISGGQIILEGRALERVPAEERPIATVFQSYGLFPHRSVLENIIYGLKFRGYKKKEAREEGMAMLKTLGLEGYENKRVTELSGGQQQRVALGRALIVKPRLLLLDEPFSNLDAKLRVSMAQELLRIRDIFRVSMIFVTHDQEDAFSLADRIILMDRGIIQQTGTARELYDRPENEFVLDFIGRSNLLEEGYLRPEDGRIIKRGQGAFIRRISFKGFYSLFEIEKEKKLYQIIRINDDTDFEMDEEVGLEMEIKRL